MPGLPFLFLKSLRPAICCYFTSFIAGAMSGQAGEQFLRAGFMAAFIAGFMTAFFIAAMFEANKKRVGCKFEPKWLRTLTKIPWSQTSKKQTGKTNQKVTWHEMRCKMQTGKNKT